MTTSSATIATVIGSVVAVGAALIPGVSEAVHDVGGQDALVGAAVLLAGFVGRLVHSEEKP